MIRGAASAASDPSAALAAAAALDGSASAVDAVIAGFFGASGAEAGVLLSPAVALVAGTGVGARAFDGRNAQPGRGAARPRGYIDVASIPDAARFPVPRAIAMVVLLHSYLGRTKLRDLARHGALIAEKAGAARRADVLRGVGDAGVLALRARDVERPLLERGGTVAGGTLTSDDLAELRPNEEPARSSAFGDEATAIGVPWECAIDAGEAPKRRGAEVVVACDGRGIVAALAYTPSEDGIAIDELDLVIGKEAIPVRRGIARLPPGTPLAGPAPVAIVARSGGFRVAIGFPGQMAVALDALSEIVRGISVEAALSDLCGRTGGRKAIAAVCDGCDARAVRSE